MRAFFLFSRKKHKDGSSLWECEERRTSGCRVSIKIRDGKLESRNDNVHKHPKATDEINRNKLRRNLLDAAKSQFDTTPSSILTTLTATVDGTMRVFPRIPYLGGSA